MKKLVDTRDEFTKTLDTVAVLDAKLTEYRNALMSVAKHCGNKDEIGSWANWALRKIAHIERDPDFDYGAHQTSRAD